MSVLTKDARGFVEGVVTYIKNEGTSGTAEDKVKKYLQKVSKSHDRAGTAVVESVVPLTTNEKNALERYIHRLTGRNFSAEYRTRPSLLGGFRVTIGEWILDASIGRQLDSLRQSLI